MTPQAPFHEPRRLPRAHRRLHGKRRLRRCLSSRPFRKSTQLTRHTHTHLDKTLLREGGKP